MRANYQTRHSNLSQSTMLSYPARLSIIFALLTVLFGCNSKPTDDPQPTEVQTLRVLSSNPRYFTVDGTNALYFASSHTWLNLQDGGVTSSPPAFSFNAYLTFLTSHHYNFIRLWTWEEARWSSETSGDFYFTPGLYQRNGPGTAIDGKPKFDLTKLNPAYFTRLRQRVEAARGRGIYVSVMLFNGWSIEDKLGQGLNNPWRGHPFNKDNNINGIDGDPNADGEGEETHTLQVPAIVDLQKAYIRRVVDELADFDNVLFEIANESHSGSIAWQYEMINYIKQYETDNEIHHPVGMTSTWPNGNNADLFGSPADWISPAGDVIARPAASGNKVILADSDHLCGVCTEYLFPWRSFLSGENPLYMDPYDRNNAALSSALVELFATTPAAEWTRVRDNLKYTACLAGELPLATMVPRPGLASSGYCLAGTGQDYVVLVDGGTTVTLNLAQDPASFSVTWLNLSTGSTTPGGTVTGGGQVTLTSPVGAEAVAWLHVGAPPSIPACFR